MPSFVGRGWLSLKLSRWVPHADSLLRSFRSSWDASMLLKSRPNLGAAMTCLEVCHCIGNSTVAIPSGPVTNAIPRRSGGRFCGAIFGAARRPQLSSNLLVTDPNSGPETGPEIGAEKWFAGLIFSEKLSRGIASCLPSDLHHFDRLPHCQRS
jgi:hypothetical protein